MFDLQDVSNIECGAESELDYYKSLQRAINSGMWSLQGSYGRAMMGAIEEGRCMLGPDSARDYWGNFIPSRDIVMPGTKGGYAFVASKSGARWADAMVKA